MDDLGRVLGVLALASWLGGCSASGQAASFSPEADAGDTDASDAASDPGDAAAGPTLKSLSVSTGALVPAFDPARTAYSVTSLNGLYPIAVTAAAADPSASLTIHGAPAQSGVASSFTLMPGEDFTVVVGSAAGASTTYTVRYVPPDLPTYTVTTAPGAGTEDVLLTANNSYLLIADRTGAPLYYRTFEPQNALDFEQHLLPSGEVAYSAAVGTSDLRGWTLGAEHVMDAQLRDVADVQLLPNRGHGVLPAEGHDFLLLGDGHYVVETYVQRTVDLSGQNPAWSPQALVMNAIVQEIDHGSVVFEWDSADFPSLYADSVDQNAFSTTTLQDYLHLNSIDVAPDGNFLFSLRHTNSIVKVDRHTGQILWTLGGKEDQFGLTSTQVFSHQHYVKVQPGGSLLVFDNGNDLHQTRILRFALDEANHKVTTFEVVYAKPAGQPQSAFMGSEVQLDVSRYFFGWGGWLTSDIEPAATEIVNGAPVWTLTFTQPTVFSYRALPIRTL